MTDRDPTKLTLEEIEADLAVSEAEAERGETVPLAPILQRLRETAARIAARKAAALPRKTARGQ
jgi:hypothetical protein